MHPGRPRKMVARKARSPQVQAGSARPSLRSGFTAYGALSSVNLADCHRAPRCTLSIVGLAPSLWGARTTRFRRPPQCRPSSAHIRVHRNSAPRFVTTRNAPHAGAERSDYTANPKLRKQEYFCAQGLTGRCDPHPTGKSPLFVVLANARTHNHRRLRREGSLPANATDRFRGLGPGVRQDDTEFSTPNLRHRIRDADLATLNFLANARTHNPRA